MKIGIDGTPLTIPFHCGVRHYAENLLDALREHDKKNDYVIFLPRKQHVAIPSGFKIVELPAVPFFKRQLFLPLYVTRERVDVFHYLEPYGSILLRHPNIVTTVHDNNLAMTYPWVSRFFLNRLHCEVTRRIVYGRTKQLVAVSTFVATEIKSMFPALTDGKKIHTNTNGYDKAIFSYTGKEKSKNYFLTMGDFTPRKNVARVLEAFAGYQKGGKIGKLIVVTSKHVFAKQFEPIIDRLGIQDRVTFAIGLTSEQLAERYRLARAFIYPSLYEGFGLPIVEAMACGCPVITSTIGAMKETARGGAILVDPYSVHAIASAMKKMENEASRKEHIAKGLSVAKHYSWKQHAQKIVPIYEEAFRG